LSPSHTWTPESEKALNFEKTLRAWAAIDERRLTGVRIVLNVGDGAPDIPLANVGPGSACAKGSNPPPARMVELFEG
jgi:predicted mannosyl-3-phosphoglycerate phosphatase (HAD superfamily)